MFELIIICVIIFCVAIKNNDIFRQTNGTHKYDKLFFIPSLYCYAVHFYFTTKQFITLLNKLNMKSLFMSSIFLIGCSINIQMHKILSIYNIVLY